MFILQVVYTIASMVFPGIISLIIDRGITIRNVNHTIQYTVCFFTTVIIIVIFQYLQRMGFAKFSQKLIADMKNKVIGKIGKTNLNFWSNHKIGDIYTIIESDIPKLETLFTTLISDTVVNLLVMAGTLGLLCYIDPTIGGMLFVAACIFAFLQRQAGTKVKKGMTEIRTQVGRQASFTNEILNYITNIQINNLFNKVQKNYQEKY